MLKAKAQLLTTLVMKKNVTSTAYSLKGIFGWTVPNLDVNINPCKAINKNCKKVIK